MQLPPVDRTIVPTVNADGAAAAGVNVRNAAAAAAAAANGSSSDPLRAGVTQPRVDTTDYLASAQGAKGPDTPSSDADTPNRDWTATPKAAVEQKQKEKEPVEPPLYKLLMNQIESLWRASTQAVDLATQSQVQAQAIRQDQLTVTSKTSPLTYTDPSKVSKTQQPPLS